MKNWRDYWNQDTPIYVGERHKALHYQRIAADIAALVPSPEAHVLDHGCGEALAAGRVAAKCARLYLADAAPLVRARLAERFRASDKIEVLAAEDVERLPDASLDLVVANSLLQYLSADELQGLLRLWRSEAQARRPARPRRCDPPRLEPGRRREGASRLCLAGRLPRPRPPRPRPHGAVGLPPHPQRARARNLREPEMIALLRRQGFTAERRAKNIGHNQARMTFEARPA